MGRLGPQPLGVPAGGAAERAHAQLGLGRVAQALATVESGLAATPDDPELLTLRARALHQLDRGGEALRAVGEALAVAPDEPGLHMIRSSVLHVRGDRAGAYEAAVEATRLAPFAPGPHRQVALVLVQDIGTRERAVAVAAHALSLDPGDPDSHVTMGITLWPSSPGGSRAQRDAARWHLMEALRLDPHHAWAMTELARTDLRGARIGSATSRIVRQAALDDGRSAGSMDLVLVFLLGLWTALVVGQLVTVMATGSLPWVGRAVSLLPPLLLALPALAWARAVPRGRRAYLRRFSRAHRVATGWAVVVTVACVAAIVIAWSRW